MLNLGSPSLSARLTRIADTSLYALSTILILWLAGYAVVVIAIRVG